MTTSETLQTWTSREAGRLAGITYRQVDYWCSEGLFGEKRRAPGSGNGAWRRFNSEDILVMRVLGQVSVTFSDPHARGTGANMTILREVAELIRKGENKIEISRVPSVKILIDVEMNRD